VDYDKVFEALEENTQKNYGIYIVDSAGSEVYEFHSFTGENVDKALNFADFCGIRGRQRRLHGYQYTACDNGLDDLYV